MLEDILHNILDNIYFLIGYIQKRTTFPDPLSPEEEREYLLKMAKGDESACQKLIEHNLRLVAHIVKKYSQSGFDNEDMISVGTIGLIKAINTYSLEKNTLLATYAARCIENEILMSIRSSRKIKSEVSINDPIGVDKEGNEISLMDILGSKSDGVMDEVILNLQVEHLISIMDDTLKPREKLVIEMRYGLKNGKFMTQREIAMLLGISRSYVSRIEKKALQKLLKQFAPE